MLVQTDAPVQVGSPAQSCHENRIDVRGSVHFRYYQYRLGCASLTIEGQHRRGPAALTLEALGEGACLAWTIVVPLSPELGDDWGSG